MSKSPFRWTTSWAGIVLSDDNLLLPNTWTITLEYDAISENMLHRDIAMQRLEFMIDEKFNTSIWTNFDNPWVDILYEKMDAFLITLPGDPYDSLIAAVAMLKAQSITRGVFNIQGCSIVSKLGYNVENVIDYNEAEDMGLSIEHKHFKDGPWYMRQDAGFTDLLVIDDNQPTLIKESSDWNEFDLNWDFYDKNQNRLTAVDSFIHNNQNERWIPLVIKGGKPGSKDENED
jgi:hypothetical protein